MKFTVICVIKLFIKHFYTFSINLDLNLQKKLIFKFFPAINIS